MTAELAKSIKNQENSSKLTGFVNKLVIEPALNEEMMQHLGHEKHQKKRGSNTRNVYSKKTVLSDDGELELAIFRYRELEKI
ncbi:transposase [Frischella sp. Ac48]|uniref:transposase n=1 Tax=Frischella sp. Ac48 TaxID=2804531 RepID=UPI001C7DAA2E|nr:transposase [Frischella sp. Ac48]MBX4133701.1 transposase [Frischella sp. Ac48]